MYKGLWTNDRKRLNRSAMMTVSDLWWHKTNAFLLATKLPGVWRRKDCVAAVSFLVEGEWSPGRRVPFQHPTSITALVQWKRQCNYTWLTKNIGIMCICAMKWGIYLYISQDSWKSAKTDIFKSLEQYMTLSFFPMACWIPSMWISRASFVSTVRVLTVITFQSKSTTWKLWIQ